jgi:hypothetical protein
MARNIRRLITGHDANGRSIAISDNLAHDVQTPLPIAKELTLVNLWHTASAPADAIDNVDPTQQEVPFAPQAGGTVFRVVDFPPDSTWLPQLTQELQQQAWAAVDASTHADKNQKTPHPFMHRTPTVDYGIVLEGEIHLLLDDSEHLLKAGDTIVQRATNHAWANRSDKMCRIAFVLVDAENI